MYDGLYYVMDSDSDSDNELYGKNASAGENSKLLNKRERAAVAKKREK